MNAKKQEFIAGKAQVFQGPIRDNKGVERVKAGEVFPLTDLRKMDWLVEGVIGQPGSAPRNHARYRRAPLPKAGTMCSPKRCIEARTRSCPR